MFVAGVRVTAPSPCPGGKHHIPSGNIGGNSRKKPADYRLHQLKHLWGGVIQFLLALGLITNAIFVNIHQAWGWFIGAGYWCAISVLAAGAFSIQAYRLPTKRAKKYARGLAMFNICIVYILIICLAIIGMTSDANTAQARPRMSSHFVNTAIGLLGVFFSILTLENPKHQRQGGTKGGTLEGSVAMGDGADDVHSPTATCSQASSIFGRAKSWPEEKDNNHQICVVKTNDTKC